MNKKKKFGFTLVELLVVIAILAILAAVSVVGYLGFTEKAKLSNDESLVNQLNTMVKSENALDDFIDVNEFKILYEENTGKSFYDLEPQTAHKGNHFWFNENKQEVILAKSNDLIENIRNKKMSLVLESQNKDLRASLIEGYYLLDSKGSRLGETIHSFEFLDSADGYLNAINSLENLKEDKFNASLHTPLAESIKTSTIITNHGSFRYEEATNITFGAELENITSNLFIFTDNGIQTTTLGKDNPVANYNGTLNIPESVETVAPYGLWFGESENIIVFDNNKDLASILYANASNGIISQNNIDYVIEDNKLISNGIEEELSYGGKITAFKLQVAGYETINDIVSVPLDKFNNGIKIEGYDFKSDEIAYDTRLKFELVSDNGTITEDGIILNPIDTEYKVEVSPLRNSELKETLTIRVGAINGIQVILNDELITFESDSKETVIAGSISEENLVYNVKLQSVKNYADIELNEEYTLEINGSTDGIEIRNNQIIISKMGTYEVVLYFDNYKETTERKIVFEIVGDVFAYENDIDLFYRFGTVNDVKIQYAPNTDKDNFELKAEIFENQNHDLKVTFKNNELMTFTGGGKATINAYIGDSVVDSFNVQIVTNAINVSKISDVKTGSDLCLTNDILVAQGTSISIASKKHFYGNNYTITLTEKTYNHHNAVFLSLSGTIDNINIIGVEVDNWYTSGSVGDKDYYKTATTVDIQNNGAKIINSSIKEGKYTVRINGVFGEIDIKNSIIGNGAVSLDVENPASNLVINLENVTISQTRERNFIGAGIAIQSGADKITFNLIGDNNLTTIYSESDLNKLEGTIGMAVSEIWKREECTDYKFSYNNEVFMHLGIVALLETLDKVPTINFIDAELEKYMTPKTANVSSANGFILALDNNKAVDYFNENISSWLENTFINKFNYDKLEPNISIKKDNLFYQYEENQEQTVDLSNEISNNITAEKYGKELQVTSTIEKIDGDGSNTGYIFNGVGKYNIKYQIKDIYEIDEVGNPNIIEINIELSIQAPAEPPKIEFTAGTKPNTSRQDYGKYAVDADFEIKADLKFNGFMGIGEFDPLYKFNLVEDLGLVATDYRGNDITLNLAIYVGDNLNSFNKIDGGINSDYQCGEEDKPAGSKDSNERYSYSKYIKIVAIDNEGRTSETVIKIAFYVPADHRWAW